MKALLQVRREGLVPILDKIDIVLRCPTCIEWGLVPGETCVCRFCGDEWEPETVSDEYASSILGVSWHDVVRGSTSPVVECPSCGDQCLVGGAVVRDGSAGSSQWVCFVEASRWEEQAVSSCDRCGTPIMMTTVDEMSVCPSCFDHALDGNYENA